jgi:hypothetical protein
VWVLLRYVEEIMEDNAAKRIKIDFSHCPICIRCNSVSPEFKEYLPWLRHLIEHIDPASRSDAWYYINSKPKGKKVFAESKISATAKTFLPIIAYWLEEALDTLPKIGELTGSGTLTAGKLRAVVEAMSEQFGEQKRFLLRHSSLLVDTETDSRWPGRNDRRIKFVAESMAGADWGLTPSSSREYIRKQDPKSRRLIASQLGFQDEAKWWEGSTLRGK